MASGADDGLRAAGPDRHRDHRCRPCPRSGACRTGPARLAGDPGAGRFAGAEHVGAFGYLAIVLVATAVIARLRLWVFLMAAASRASVSGRLYASMRPRRIQQDHPVHRRRGARCPGLRLDVSKGGASCEASRLAERYLRSLRRVFRLPVDGRRNRPTCERAVDGGGLVRRAARGRCVPHAGAGYAVRRRCRGMPCLRVARCHLLAGTGTGDRRLPANAASLVRPALALGVVFAAAGLWSARRWAASRPLATGRLGRVGGADAAGDADVALARSSAIWTATSPMPPSRRSSWLSMQPGRNGLHAPRRRRCKADRPSRLPSPVRRCRGAPCGSHGIRAWADDSRARRCSPRWPPW